MTDEITQSVDLLQKELERRIREEKIYFYADALKMPSDTNWEKMPGFIMPHPHDYQRKMTFPQNGEMEKFKKAKFYLYFAGNKGGKTVWLVNWIGMEALGIHPLQELGLRPKGPVHWWCVSPNLPSESDVPRGEDAPILKKFYEWIPDGKNGIKKFYRKDKILLFTNGSVVNFKSHDQEKGKFKSEDVDGIGWDEEPPKGLWEEGVPRILTKNGIFLLSMTADYGSWTFSLIRHKNEPEYFICEMDSLENPFMPAEHRKQMLATMSDDQLLMRRFGRHIQFKGKVFPFEYDRNVGKPFEVSNNNVTGIIIDWHPAKPILVSYLQINPRNIWYVWNESSIEEKTVGRVAQEIRSKLSFPGFNVRVKKYIIDRIAKMEQVQETGQKAKDIVQMFRTYGISCEIGNPSFGPAHTYLCDKLNHREIYFDPDNCPVHIEQFDTWGAKRYMKGNLEGTLRDMLEVEGNDACINMVYAYNAGLKYEDNIFEEMPYTWQPRSTSSRIYGGHR